MFLFGMYSENVFDLVELTCCKIKEFKSEEGNLFSHSIAGYAMTLKMQNNFIL